MHAPFTNLSPELAAITQCMLIAYRRGMQIRNQSSSLEAPLLHLSNESSGYMAVVANNNELMDQIHPPELTQSGTNQYNRRHDRLDHDRRCRST
jgi:hypothetical protein